MNESQQKVWNNIAPDWNEFKIEPSKTTQNFLRNKSGKILDLGCGSGRNIIGLKTKAEFYFVDFSQEMIKFVEKRAKNENINFKSFVSKAENLLFKDNFFDSAIFIACLHCIETENKREKSLKELYRVLKPEAEVLLSVWDWNSKWFTGKPKDKYMNWKDKGKRYYYLYTKDELENLLKKMGFEIKNIETVGWNIYATVQKPN